ncbi:MAG: YcgN family cysteine cluster protein [Methylococcaceae bacterium]|nr:YcgN family cysteine cluster protein [Methylococcaceae bacterium]
MKFWETKKLNEMTTEEWESLCDNCGKCCLVKLEDDETDEIYFTSVVCDLIDLDTCRCTNYAQRCKLVPECIDLKQHDDFKDYTWLPSTCAYRLLADGEPLSSWHPLVTGDATSTKEAGVSVSSYAVKEKDIGDDDLQDYVLDWIGKIL